ncbi:Hypothetical protein SCLAV_4789 [Streptomyces clavuligerus]|uniref:Uncharacterized protein n=2 Tax=Streptomyces clavuligerus TaxID=1901 RepID=E2PUW5_STRCL|nr:Hypothetical protein SCLAV_4789 [Streptomyces clavuligerus]
MPPGDHPALPCRREPRTEAHPVPPTHDEGAHMDAFTAGLLQRIKAAESDLTLARESGDDFLADVEQAELDDLRRLAAEHGVRVG